MSRLILTSLILTLAAGPALAAKCAKREIVAQRLTEKYQEHLVGAGVQEHPQMTSIIELWVSAETGTFTVLLTSPQGVSCFVASGVNWETMMPAVEDPDA